MVSQDDKLKDSHNHLFKAALPLAHLFDALVDASCSETIETSRVEDHVTSALIFLGSASQKLELLRQHAFDKLLDRKFDSLKKNLPSMSYLFGGDVLKYIDDAQKVSKLAAKVTKSVTSKSALYKGNRFPLSIRQ